MLITAGLKKKRKKKMNLNFKEIIRLTLLGTILKLLVIIYCSDRINILPEKIGQDKSVIPFVEEFVRLSYGKIKIEDLDDINIGFSNINNKTLETKTIGFCRKNIFYKEIILDKETWNKYSFNKKFILLSHELIHCHCDKEHTDQYLDDKCPSDIMNKTMPNDYCIKKHLTNYIARMYDGC